MIINILTINVLHKPRRGDNDYKHPNYQRAAQTP